MFKFDWIYSFFLLPLPFLIYWILPKVKQQNKIALKVPFFDTLSNETINSRQFININFIDLLNILAWIALILTIAKPVWVSDSIKLPVKGKDVMLAVDLSGSMQEKDFILNGQKVDRLTAVKKTANEFIDKRKKDRIGLVVFGSQAYLYAPLTFDTALVKQFLNESRIRMAGEKTAIGDAIALAIKHFSDSNIESEKNKILILLTDGANSAGVIDPREAVKLAKLENLKIYTIGIGTDAIKGFFFRRASIDEALLKFIAAETGAKYFRAKNTKGLEQIYNALDKLESIDKEDKIFRPIKDLFFYPLALSLFLYFLIILLKLR